MISEIQAQGPLSTNGHKPPQRNRTRPAATWREISVTEFRVTRHQPPMDEQGIPQVSNAELIADLEAILLELRDRLNNFLDLGAEDLIAADEGFNFAGQLQATLADAVEHTAPSSLTRASQARRTGRSRAGRMRSSPLPARLKRSWDRRVLSLSAKGGWT
jgi:hypothetical protein